MIEKERSQNLLKIENNFRRPTQELAVELALVAAGARGAAHSPLPLPFPSQPGHLALPVETLEVPLDDRTPGILADLARPVEVVVEGCDDAGDVAAVSAPVMLFRTTPMVRGRLGYGKIGLLEWKVKDR